jgi:hypothetical protein
MMAMSSGLVPNAVTRRRSVRRPAWSSAGVCRQRGTGKREARPGAAHLRAVQDGLKGCKAVPDGKGPITIKTWLRYAEKRVPQLYDDIRAGKLKVVGFSLKDEARELVAKDSTIDLAFYSQTVQHAQTPALFDFYKRANDPVLQLQ